VRCPPASGTVFHGPSVGRALRLTWGAARFAPQPPENSLKPTENSPKPEFSTLWKKFFHSVEKSRKYFPYCGKIRENFSIVWKTMRPPFVSITYECHAAAPRMPLGGAGRPLWPQNAFFAAPIFSLANRPGFCDKFGSSEMLCVRTCSFHFAF
jgi:hypothetical protein